MKAPRRLTDPASGTPRGLRELLEAGRSELPSAERLRSLGDRLAPTIAGLSAGTGSGAGPATGGAGVGASSGGAAAVHAAQAVAGWKVGLAVVGIAAIGSGIAARSIENRRSTAPTTAPFGTLAVPNAPATAFEHGAVSDPSPSAASPPTASPARTQLPLPGAVPARPVPAAAAEETEIDLLRDARASLATAPSRALAIAERHATRFPSGVLAEEREVIAIEALVRLGRRAEARARADRFFVLHPSSAYRPRIDALLGDRDASGS